MEAATIWPRAAIVPSLTADCEFSISPQDMLAFATLSGDYNPLHTDAEFARAKGFDGPVVYGALLVAKVSRLIGMQLPGRDCVWSSVDLRFHRPLLVDVPACLRGTVTTVSTATGLVQLALEIRAGQQLIAKGKAEVLLVGA